jgi:hypothetical protein
MKTPWWQALLSNVTKEQRRSVMLRESLRRLIDEGGTIGWHSSLGATLSYYIIGLEEAGVPYTLSAVPGLGYVLQANKNKSYPYLLPLHINDD